MKLTRITSFLSMLLFLVGCASYQARGLTALEPDEVKEYKEAEGLKIGCKAFTEDDCFQYLDRNILELGFQPVQLTFFNSSKESYFFSTEKLSLPCVSTKAIKDCMYTSTVGRVTGYTLGSLIIPPLFIAAVVDGILSFNSNQKIDMDLSLKAKQDFIIPPGCYHKVLFFVPKNSYKSNFSFTLVESASGENKLISLQATK